VRHSNSGIMVSIQIEEQTAEALEAAAPAAGVSILEFFEVDGATCQTAQPARRIVSSAQHLVLPAFQSLDTTHANWSFAEFSSGEALSNIE
jgi:hypothetical protein